MKTVLCLMIVCSMFISGCASAAWPEAPAIPNGNVEALQNRTTILGINRAMNGSAGTMVMKNGEKYLFMWEMHNGGDRWGFVAVDASASKVISKEVFTEIRGNVANSFTVGELATYLKESGWDYVHGTEIPRTIKVSVSNAAPWLGAGAICPLDCNVTK